VGRIAALNKTRAETQHCFFCSQRLPHRVDFRLSTGFKNLRLKLTSNLSDYIENTI
jgi:hypothetical protein